MMSRDFLEQLLEYDLVDVWLDVNGCEMMPVSCNEHNISRKHSALHFVSIKLLGQMCCALLPRRVF